MRYSLTFYGTSDSHLRSPVKTVKPFLLNLILNDSNMIDQCFSNSKFKLSSKFMGEALQIGPFSQDKTAKSKSLFDSKHPFHDTTFYFPLFTKVVANFIFLEGDSVMFCLLSYQIILSSTKTKANKKHTNRVYWSRTYHIFT